MKWFDLKRDSHVRLSCGCEGFVKSIHFENDPLMSGFTLLHTVKDCGRKTSCEELYMSGKGPYKTFFNATLAEDACPIEDAPIPSWWNLVIADKTNPEIKI